MSIWQSPKSILLGTDFTEPAARAGEVARRLALHFDSHLSVAHAVDLPPVIQAYASDAKNAAHDAASRWLENLENDMATEGLNLRMTARSGAAAAVLVDEASERQCDLVVVGCHGRSGLKRFFLGSVAEAVARRAPCSVLTVEGAGDAACPSRIVVGIDFSEWSEHTMSAAGALAATFDAHLHVIHSLDHRLSFPISVEEHVPANVLELARDGALQRLNDLLASRAPGVDATVEVHDAVPYEVLCERADALQADLLVVGTHGHGGLARALIGGVAERTLRSAPCAVWAVRPPMAQEAFATEPAPGFLRTTLIS